MKEIRIGERLPYTSELPVVLYDERDELVGVMYHLHLLTDEGEIDCIDTTENLGPYLLSVDSPCYWGDYELAIKVEEGQKWATLEKVAELYFNVHNYFDRRYKNKLP